MYMYVRRSLAPLEQFRTIFNLEGGLQRVKWERVISLLSNNLCTFIPYKMISWSKVWNVSDVAITPTSMDAITRPVMIQTTANTLAHTPTGTLSPYLRNKHKHPMINLNSTIIWKAASTTYLARHCLTNSSRYCQASVGLVISQYDLLEIKLKWEQFRRGQTRCLGTVPAVVPAKDFPASRQLRYHRFIAFSYKSFPHFRFKLLETLRLQKLETALNLCVLPLCRGHYFFGVLTVDIFIVLCSLLKPGGFWSSHRLNNKYNNFILPDSCHGNKRKPKTVTGSFRKWLWEIVWFPAWVLREKENQKNFIIFFNDESARLNEI